jgi:hypothetical protein
MSLRSITVALLASVLMTSVVPFAFADEGPFKTNPEEVPAEQRIPPYLPSPPPLPQQSPSPVFTPGPAPHSFAAPANPGPVTGYGTGGMQAMPGAPANPPYSTGGFGSR